jgi:hypothetical protein
MMGMFNAISINDLNPILHANREPHFVNTVALPNLFGQARRYVQNSNGFVKIPNNIFEKSRGFIVH